MTESPSEISTENASASVVSRLTRVWSPRPMALAMTEEVPAIRPIPRLTITITTGKMKLMAASSGAPSWAQNQVSMTLKDIIARMPQIIGTVRPTRCARTDPSVNVAREAEAFCTERASLGGNGCFEGKEALKRSPRLFWRGDCEVALSPLAAAG